VPAEGRRRCDGDTEGAAQQQLMVLCSLGFAAPSGDGSHAFIQSPRSCDSGRSAGRYSSAAEVLQGPLRPPLRRWSPAFRAPLPRPFRSRCRTADPVSRRHGSLIARTPAAAVHQHRHIDTASPVPGRRQHRRSISAFLHTGLVNLFIQSGPSTACPGTGTGHGTASPACHPTLHQRAVNSRIPELREKPQRGWVAAVVLLASHAFAPQPSAITLGSPGCPGISDTRVSRVRKPAMDLHCGLAF
jgi:hypothetical protein